MLAVAPAVLTVSGCGSGAVRVEPPVPSPAAAVRACAALAGELPQTLGDRARRATRPESGTVAAWGDPAVVLRCGVPRPAALRPTSELATVDGVDWFPERLSKGWAFTTTGREAYVEVSVPSTGTTEAGVLTYLAGPVLRADPVRSDGRP